VTVRMLKDREQTPVLQVLLSRGFAAQVKRFLLEFRLRRRWYQRRPAVNGSKMLEFCLQAACRLRAQSKPKGIRRLKPELQRLEYRLQAACGLGRGRNRETSAG